MEKGGDVLLRRNQVFTLVTIAVISFLIGTMFSVMATESGNPWDRVWTAITGLESRVETLEEQSLLQGFITAPAYDSGWVTVTTPSSWFEIEHNLNTTEILVYAIRNDTKYGINQMGYSHEVGWLWLTKNSLWIAMADVEYGDQVRVMIWKISEPTT